MKKQWVLAGLVIAALLLCGCGDSRGSPEPQPGEGREQEAAAMPTVSTESQPAQPLPAAASDVILMDGELESAYPALELSFPENASGRIEALRVQLGQRVKEGDLLATLDDSELQTAVAKARLDLDRALEDKAQGEAEIERTYQRETDDAQRAYERATHDAELKYQREREDARRALEEAERDLKRAQMQPPTTAVAEAETELVRALDSEADASDDYKQALDRPWEPQEIRDSLYKTWQARIVDRELAQLRLEDAQIALQVHRLDLQTKGQAVKNAAADLERVEKDPVDKDVVDREVNLAYDRAIQDARLKLEEAEADLENARLYAPWDGLVLALHAGVGSVLGAGTPVVTLLNPSNVYFGTENLSERHVAQLRQGQAAEITLRAYPDTVLSGMVDVVLPQQERTSDADARFVAYIRLDESDLDLLPGMTGRVEVATGDQ